jgi:hypothetical protein
MAYCLVWTLFISRLKLSTKFLVAAPLLLDIVIDAAREPFLTIVVMVALLTWVWTLEKSAIARRKIRIVVGVFLTLCLAAAVSASVLADTYVIKKFVNIGGGSLDDLTGDRSQKISDFLGDIRDHPLFGQLMQFSTDSRLTPHNQFVEALLRGGIFFLIALSAPIAWVMVVTIRRLLRVRKLEPVVQMALVLSVTFFFVNWNINTPFRSPFCMIYVGMVFGMASTHQAAWRRAPARGRQGRPRPWSGGGPVAAGARRAHWT